VIGAAIAMLLGGLWIRSFFRSDEIGIATGGHALRFAANPQQIHIFWVADSGALVRHYPSAGPIYVNLNSHRVLDIEWRQLLPRFQSRAGGLHLWLPDWIIMVLPAIPAIWWGIEQRRLMRDDASNQPALS